MGRRTTRRLRATLASIGAVAAMAVAAAPAAEGSAVTISSGSRVNVTSSGNERNDFVVALETATNTYRVLDPVGIDANGLCTQLDPDTASCPAAGIGSITVNAGGGADTAFLSSSIPASVESTLDGGSGNDRIAAAGAADVLDGDSGDDVLDGGGGADEIRGGSNTDTVVYAARLTALTVTIGSGDDNDGNELDQTGLRRDTVRGDVEGLIGGSGPDLIFGDGSGEFLSGGLGDDRIYGQSGGDSVNGGPGRDVLSGSSGGDTLIGGADGDILLGGAQSDRLAGGDGDDRLIGKKGPDAMNGKAGIDRIFARDGGRDLKINCGAGNNRGEGAKRDKLDPRGKSC